MSPPAGVPYVNVWRGDLVESVHAVAAAATDRAGALALAYGDIDTPIFLRSAAKPFIAATIVADGTAARFGLSERELAIVSGSHAGEPFHVATVHGILAKIGLPESSLQCGVHAPYSESAASALASAAEPPSAVHSNCSGKHAGILASCVAHGEDVTTYLHASHPVQRRILALCARLLAEPEGSLRLAVDGCGVPVFATPLRRAARAFACFAAPEESPLHGRDIDALRRVAFAMAAAPAYVAGTGRFDTALSQATAGNILGKAGAEGIHGDALRREGLGLAVKVVDGATRAIPPATLGLLRELGALAKRERAELETFAEPSLRNVAGQIVGRLAAGTDTIRTVSASLGVPSLPKD